MYFSQSDRTNGKLSADTQNVCLFNQPAKPARSPALGKYQQQVFQVHLKCARIVPVGSIKSTPS